VGTADVANGGVGRRGLDIAQKYRIADRDENGEWVAGDLSRLGPA